MAHVSSASLFGKQVLILAIISNKSPILHDFEVGSNNFYYYIFTFGIF